MFHFPIGFTPVDGVDNVRGKRYIVLFEISAAMWKNNERNQKQKKKSKETSFYI